MDRLNGGNGDGKDCKGRDKSTVRSCITVKEEKYNRNKRMIVF